MRIRSKLTGVLLAVALGPLFVVALRDISATRALSAKLQDRTKLLVRDRVAAELGALVQQFAATLDAERRQIEVMVSVQAAALEDALSRTEPAPPAGEVYTSSDFDDPDRAPPRLVEVPSKHYVLGRDGQRRLLRVSYQHPVFVPAPGVRLDAHPRDVSTLLGLVPTMRTLHEADPGPMVSQFACLESGVHAAYPGKGNYPTGYDGRERAWYRGAARRGDIFWQIPIVDAPTGQVRMTCARPFAGPEGRIAGVTGIDVLMLAVLERVRLPAEISGDARTLLVRAVPSEDDTTEDRVTIVASHDYETGDRQWTTEFELAELRAPPGDHADFAGFVGDIARGDPGARLMKFEGSPHIWGYGPITGGLAVVVIVPTSVVDAAVAPLNADFESHTSTQVGFVAASAAAVGILVVALAYASSKTLTRPIRKLVNAVERVGAGDFSTRVRVRSGDEVGKLARAFNELVPRLERHVTMTNSLTNDLLSQETLRPDRLPDVPGFDVYAETRRLDPADPADFLDLVDDGPTRWTFAVGDVATRGVSAAMVMTSARSLFRSHAGEFDALGPMLFTVNRALHADARFGHVLPLAVVGVDASEPHTVRLVCAGRRVVVMVIKPGEQAQVISASGVAALGVDPDTTFDERSIGDLTPGSVVLVMTDGITDAKNDAGDGIDVSWFVDAVRNHDDVGAAAIGRRVLDGAEQFTGGLTDDATVLVLRRTET